MSGIDQKSHTVGLNAPHFTASVRKDKKKKQKTRNFVSRKSPVVDKLYGGSELYPSEGNPQWFDLKVRFRSDQGVVYDDSGVCGEVDANGVLLSKNPDAGRASIMFSLIRYPSLQEGHVKPVCHTVVNYEFPCVAPDVVGVFYQIPYSEVGVAVTKRLQMFMLKKLRPTSAHLTIKCLLNMYRSLRLTYPGDVLRLYSVCVISVKPPRQFEWSLLPILTHYDVVADKDIEIYETVLPPERPDQSHFLFSPSVYMQRHYISRMTFVQVADAVIPVFHSPNGDCGERM